VAEAAVRGVLDSVVASFVAMDVGAAFGDDSLFSERAIEARQTVEEPPKWNSVQSMSFDAEFSSYSRSQRLPFIRRNVLEPESRVHPSQHHVSEWMSYAPPPINVGLNKKHRRSIASAYDRQTLIHPSLFGIAVRWKGDNDLTEAHYTHPVFHGYALNRAALSGEQTERLRQETLQQRKPNPFKWTPTASQVRTARSLRWSFAIV
jgi:hypothetical protein